MDGSKLLATLRRFDALRDGEAGKDAVHQRSLPAVAPTYAEASFFDGLAPVTVEALRRSGIDRMYRHQTAAIQHALDGANVVLQAPTASGKTLAFQVPMLQSLREPGTHALMIYPNKALALDQRDQLMKISGPDIESWWYDGDVDHEQRRAIRTTPPSILITNPDMLHSSFLGHADKWGMFYPGLRWVIVDEIHEYRGYFGSNVAMILRRFSHHLASRGVNPQFFLSSATCANAQEHAENLTGRPFVEINATDQMRPQRQFIFVQPDIPDYQYWRILQLRVVRAGLACLSEGLAVLAFCPTRKFAEECHSMAMRELEKLGHEASSRLTPEAIRVFRAGLSVEDRHAVQAGLKSGDVGLVFTTNALEMGIDIGGLDGVIMAGFPDSMMSAWQRIGRAGRSWDSRAFVLYYARNNPLDRFYATNLQGFLTKPLDDLVVNPGNDELIARQLPSLMYETPNAADDGRFLGPAMRKALQKKRTAGVQPVRSGRYRPHHSLPIRGADSGTFILKEGKREIGTLSAQQQFREAYERAVYMHGGKAYRVREISSTGNGGEITLESTDPAFGTNPSTSTFVTERDIFNGRRWSASDSSISTFYGKVLIVQSLNAVEEFNVLTSEVVDRWIPQINKAEFRNAHAFWIEEEADSDLARDGISAFQHLLRVGALFSIPLDAHDLFPHATAKDRKAYLIESYPGGIGIANKLLDKWRSALEFGIGVAERCKCPRGCPNCIVPPRSREELDKVVGIQFARAVLEATAQASSFGYRNGLWEPSAPE